MPQRMTTEINIPVTPQSGMGRYLIRGLILGLIILSGAAALRELHGGCSCVHKPWMTIVPFAGIAFYGVGVALTFHRSFSTAIVCYLAIGFGTHIALLASLLLRDLSCILCATSTACSFLAVAAGLWTTRAKLVPAALIAITAAGVVGFFAIP